MKQLSPWTTTTEPELLSQCAAATEAHTSTAHAPKQEEPQQGEACAPNWSVSLTATRESLQEAMKTLHNQ